MGKGQLDDDKEGGLIILRIFVKTIATLSKQNTVDVEESRDVTALS